MTMPHGPAHEEIDWPFVCSNSENAPKPEMWGGGAKDFLVQRQQSGLYPLSTEDEWETS